jgi:hypothetical protein
MVVDRGGGRSAPCELIAYDARVDDEMLPLVEIGLFPVEMVRAVFAVEAALDEAAAARALAKLATVDALELPAAPLSVLASDRQFWLKGGSQAARPLGVVCAAASAVVEVEQVLTWFTVGGGLPAGRLVAGLDQCLIRSVAGRAPEAWIFPVGEGGVPHIPESEGLFSDATGHPLRSLGGLPFFADPVAALLVFLLSLGESIAFMKRTVELAPAVACFGVAHLGFEVAPPSR